jgi:hypothetical protein
MYSGGLDAQDAHEEQGERVALFYILECIQEVWMLQLRMDIVTQQVCLHSRMYSRRLDAPTSGWTG